MGFDFLSIVLNQTKFLLIFTFVQYRVGEEEVEWKGGRLFLCLLHMCMFLVSIPPKFEVTKENVTGK